MYINPEDSNFKKMKKAVFYLIVLLLFTPLVLWPQGEDAEVPLTLESPYQTIRAHLHYLQPDNYQPKLAAQTLYNVRDSLRKQRLAIQLKQVLDGLGLYVRLKQIPQDVVQKSRTIIFDLSNSILSLFLFINDIPSNASFVCTPILFCKTNKFGNKISPTNANKIKENISVNIDFRLENNQPK